MTNDLIEQLCEVFLRLENTAEVRAFLRDVCTPLELKDLSERWNVCLLLNQGKTYRAISQETGVSLTTIVRVAKFLKNQPYKGYQMVLKKMENKQ
jgi:TrpR-related protein YerC/YecD